MDREGMHGRMSNHTRRNPDDYGDGYADAASGAATDRAGPAYAAGHAAGLEDYPGDGVPLVRDPLSTEPAEQPQPPE
jgi:hypothetical protein